MYLSEGFKFCNPNCEISQQIFFLLQERITKFAGDHLSEDAQVLLCKFFNGGEITEILFEVAPIKFPCDPKEWDAWDEENWDYDLHAIMGDLESDLSILSLLKSQRITAGDLSEQVNQRLGVDDLLIGMYGKVLRNTFRKVGSRFYNPGLVLIVINDALHFIGKEATLALNENGQASMFLDMTQYAAKE